MSAHETERLAGYLDGELSPADRAEVEAHLGTCAQCRTLLAELGSVDERASALSVDAPEGYFEAFPGRVRARLEARGSRAKAPPAARPRRLPTWTWAAAAALILAVVTPMTLRQAPQGATPPRPVQARPSFEAPPAALERPSPARDEIAATAGNRPVDPAPLTEPADGDLGVAGRLAERQDVRLQAQEVVAEPEAGFADAPPPPAPAGAAPVVGRSRETVASAPEERSRPLKKDASDLRAATAGEDVEGGALEMEEKVAAVAEADREAPSIQASAPGLESVTAPKQSAASAADRRRLPPLSVAIDDETSRKFTELSLTNLNPADAPTWRQRREAWRRFAQENPESVHANEARVQVIETGLHAWRASGDTADLALARRDADAYLARADATLAQRVEKALGDAKAEAEADQ